jgi:hypothetical protein
MYDMDGSFLGVLIASLIFLGFYVGIPFLADSLIALLILVSVVVRGATNTLDHHNGSKLTA